jgi:hypothetical protein
LDKNELTVYKVLDTLNKNNTYKFYRDASEILIKGIKDIGNIRIGPWYYWISGNDWEGARFRFDVSTNRGFHKKLYLMGYAAYGTKDGEFKGGGEIKYLFNKENWTYLKLVYRNDLDVGMVTYDQIGTDNLFATILRRPNIPFKFQQLAEKRIEFYKETGYGFGYGFSGSSKQFTALQNLPGKEYFTQRGTDPFNSFETVLKIRFAYLERSLESNFLRYSLGSDYPIVDIKYTKGWNQVLDSHYDYHKIDGSISQNLKISPYGTLYYNFFGGKVFGTLPYQFLDMVPGNEMYYYNKYAFNLMHRFEYLSDQYVGGMIEHNFGPGIFKFFKLTRKLKLRQFWNAKGIVGGLSDENKQMNYVGHFPYRSLDNQLYAELGTGISNILNFFRIDLVWRVAAPNPLVGELRDKFGMFVSYRLQF